MAEGYRRAYSLGAHCPALFPPRVEAVEHVEAVEPSPPDVGVHPALTLLVLLVGTFMTSMDVAIVNVAGPSIQGDLHMSGASLQRACWPLVGDTLPMVARGVRDPGAVFQYQLLHEYG
jgi:hypothetical protein